MARPPEKVEVAVVEVALKVEAVAMPKTESEPSNKDEPVTEKMAPGVVVPMPRRLEAVLAVSRDTPLPDWISNALPEEVATRSGSAKRREANCPPIASKVVVPEESVETER